jgi:hypothetical protein
LINRTITEKLQQSTLGIIEKFKLKKIP